MEKILAVMDPATTHFSAGIHALNLAKRIRASVLFLLIHSPSAANSTQTQERAEASIQKQLTALMEEAWTDGVAIEYYVTHGRFENEAVSFAREKKITLLVIESSIEGEGAEGTFLEKIRHRLNCRIEVVNEKPESLERKE